jgi:hypothetical protein
MADAWKVHYLEDRFRYLNNKNGTSGAPALVAEIGNDASGFVDRISAFERQMGRVETAVEGLRGAQSLGFGAVLAALGLLAALMLGLMVYFGQDVGGQLRDMNARFDRLL